MPRAPQTARSERTREALRQAALVRFLAQGVEDTSAEQIAADAGVSLRTFYRHFSSKHDLLFADYDAGLQWFRSALADRPAGEPIIESVQAAIFAFPYDVEAVTRIANTPAFIKGVINLRGLIVPIVDLRIKFSLSEPTYDEFTVAIILNIGKRVIGVVVDGCPSLIPLVESDIQTFLDKRRPGQSRHQPHAMHG